MIHILFSHCSETITSVESESQPIQSPMPDDKEDDTEDDTQDDIQNDTQQHLLLDDDNTQEDTQIPMQKTDSREQFSQKMKTPRTKKRKANATLDLLSERETQRSLVYKKLLKKSSPTIPKQTPIKKFFDSMADIVETFPPHVQAAVRLKVCELVTETEIKQLQAAHVAPSMSTNSSISTTAQPQYVVAPLSSGNSSCFSTEVEYVATNLTIPVICGCNNTYIGTKVFLFYVY